MRTLSPILLLSVMSGMVVTAQTPPSGPNLPTAYTQTVQRVVSARTEVVGAAGRLKAWCAREKKDCVTQAGAYDKAKGAYDGWIATMKLSIKQGKARKLKVDDPDYKAVAEPAAKESAAFVNNAEQTMVGQTKAAAPAVLAIVDLGVKIWKEIRNAKQETRDSEAEAFAKEVAWPNWSDIK